MWNTRGVCVCARVRMCTVGTIGKFKGINFKNKQFKKVQKQLKKHRKGTEAMSVENDG